MKTTHGVVDLRNATGICNEDAILTFTGTHSECVSHMEGLFDQGQKPEIDFDLVSVIPCENGLFEIGILSSYVLHRDHSSIG